MADEWFRSPSWAPDDRVEFERRLQRSRPYNRPQYLKIKALALADTQNVDAAIDLLERVVSLRDAYAFEVAFAHELLGGLRVSQGRSSDAEHHYREAIAIASPTMSGTTGEVHIALGELLIARDGMAARDEVEALLIAAHEHLKLNCSVFRGQVLRFRLATTCGDVVEQRAAANRALALTEVGPQFSRHPTVGLARPTAELLSELRRFANE